MLGPLGVTTSLKLWLTCNRSYQHRVSCTRHYVRARRSTTRSQHHRQRRRCLCPIPKKHYMAPTPHPRRTNNSHTALANTPTQTHLDSHLLAGFCAAAPYVSHINETGAAKRFRVERAMQAQQRTYKQRHRPPSHTAACQPSGPAAAPAK